MKFFAYCGDPERFLSRLLLRGMKRYGREFFEKVAREDAGIMPSIQRGLQARRHPSEGLISVREERLFHFQEFILQATADDPPREHHKESFYSEPVSADA